MGDTQFVRQTGNLVSKLKFADDNATSRTLVCRRKNPRFRASRRSRGIQFALISQADFSNQAKTQFFIRVNGP